MGRECVTISWQQDQSRTQKKKGWLSYDGERFETSIFLMTLNRVAAVILCLPVGACVRREPLEVAPSFQDIRGNSVSNLCANTIQHVSVPVKTLGKNFKTMSVMHFVSWQFVGSVTM